MSRLRGEREVIAGVKRLSREEKTPLWSRLWGGPADELVDLRGEVERLRAENAALRLQLSRARKPVETPVEPKAPVAPEPRSERSGDEGALLAELHGRYRAKVALSALYAELGEAKDGFQKLKIWRKHLPLLDQIEELRVLVAPYRADKSLLKSRAALTALQESLKTLTDLEAALVPHLERWAARREKR